MDTVLQAAYVQAIGTVLASSIAACVGGWFAQRWLKQQTLQAQLAEARVDIQFLLEIERLYIEQAKSHSTIPGKNIMRATATSNGYVWSGKNTPGRLRSDQRS